MNPFQALIFGIVEGISEFLPISSTFHLLIAKEIVGLADSYFLTSFIVIIQSGAIFAALALYGKRIAFDHNLFINLLVSFIPTALVGGLSHDFIKQTLFANNTIQIISFIVVGILFIVFEKYIIKKDSSTSWEKISRGDALLIGFFQSFAIIPGVSRSGIVLLFMLWRGYTRSSSAEYTFMLGIPTLIAASVFDFVDLTQHLQAITPLLFPLSIGWFVSFFIALISMKWFVDFLKQHDLSIFGWYRLILGVILLIGF